MSRKSRSRRLTSSPRAAAPASLQRSAEEHRRGGQREFVRYLWSAFAIAGGSYVAYYYPHPEASLAWTLIEAYLRVQTALAGSLIGAFDDSVIVTGTMIAGRFPLQIVKDCSSLDAQALLAGAIFAFPAPLAQRWAGVICGLVALNLVNLLRIASLYFVGIHARAHFDTVHEEVMPLGLILTAGLIFFGWTAWRPALTVEREHPKR